MAGSVIKEKRMRNKFIKNAKSLQFGFPFFKKKKQTDPIVKQDSEEIQFQKDKPILDQIFNEFFELTKKPTIEFTLGYEQSSDTDPNGRYKSKLGGVPYWPESLKDKYPSNAVLYAQINFAELPHLDGYPSKGILQFFTDGWIWDGPSNKYSTQYTFYHENIDTTTPQMEIKDTTCNMSDDEAPFTGVFYFDSSKLTMMCMQEDDDRPGCDFNEIMNPLIKKYLGLDVKYLFYLPTKHYRYLSEKIYNYGWGNRIGGYPNFTQADASDETYNTLLFQVDSGGEIMWGDCGISNIFINNIALSKNDFSNLYYTWDCY